MPSPAHSYHIPPDSDLETLIALLRTDLGLDEGRPIESRRTWYDSFDWRLWSAGTELLAEETGGQTRLQWRDLGQGGSLASLGDAAPPRFAWDLPPGPLRERLSDHLEMRALLPVAVVHSRVRKLRQRNAEGKLTLELAVEEGRVSAPDGGPEQSLGLRLGVSAVKGYEAAGADLARLIAGRTDLVPAPPLLEQALAALGRRPGDYDAKPRLALEPAMRSDEATRAILGDLLETMERNAPGMIEDIDTEFLHDFRVAVRRSRTALAQVKGVLPPGVVERFRVELAWLGQVTGPTRDLDVYLLQFEDYHAALPPELRGELGPLRRFLERHRAAEQSALARELRSPRYARFVQAWRRALAAPASPPPSPPNAGRPIGRLASERIWRMVKRVLREGAAITPDSPDTELHELRKSCKKLRYLMEFFQSLYPADEVKARIKALKALQDNLGEFQDLSVQIETLRHFADQMIEEGDAPGQTLIAMGALVERLHERQLATRGAFAQRFAQFAQPESREGFRALFKNDPPTERLAG